MSKEIKLKIKGIRGNDGVTPIKGVNYFTKEEQDEFVLKVMNGIKLPKDGVDGKDVDYSKVEEFIKSEIAKIPKPLDGVDGISPIIDYDSLIITILEKIPKQPDTVIDYKSIEKFCEEHILRIERSRPRLLNSGGPTTRLGEISDVSITTPTNAQVLKYNSVTGKWENGTASGGVQSIVAGINISVDDTDPSNPIVNSLSDRYKTTSTTSQTIVSTGPLTFTVDANLAYTPQQDVIIAHDANNHMHGIVLSYSGTTLEVDIKHKTGSGTYSSWIINLDGIAGTVPTAPENGSVTRVDDFIDTITKGTTVWAISRDIDNRISSFTNTINTWTINRDVDGRITNWSVV
jgi:hypothetical protein